MVLDSRFLEERACEIESELNTDFESIRSFILSMQKDEYNCFEYNTKLNYLEISGRRKRDFRVRNSYIFSKSDLDIEFTHHIKKILNMNLNSQMI